MDLSALSNESLAKLDAAIALHKSTFDATNTTPGTMPSGLSGVNLEAPAKLIVPILAPFRQSIPRKTIGGRGTNWKRITAVSRGGTLKSADGVRSSGFTVTSDDVQAVFSEYGKFGDVTWAGVPAAANYEDVRARAEILCLLQLLRDEEAAMLGAATVALGAGAAVTVTAADTGGALTVGAKYVYIVPLSQIGVLGASRIARPIAGNKYDFTTVPTLNLVDGVGLPSTANATGTIGSVTTGQLTCTWTWAPGVSAYAVYVGTTSGSTNAKLQGIVTQGKIVITAINTTGAIPPTSDTSANGPFLGILGQLVASGSGAYVKDLAAAPLSAAVGRGIPELDAMFDDIYDRVKEEPDRIVMGWQEHRKIDDAMSAVANDRVKFNIAISGNQSAEVLPRFTSVKTSRGKTVLMEENPNLPGGTILALKDSVDIPNSDIPNAWQMHMGRDLMRLDYAFANPKYEFENRAYGALAGYAPSFQGCIYNIANF